MSGDISSLLHLGTRNNIYPSDVAKLFNELPFDVGINSFKNFPIKKQLAVFPFLDILFQKKILTGLTRERASYLLNKISSDDRVELINSYKGVRRRLLGMEVLHGLHYDLNEDEWVDGVIYDATTGKNWDSVVWLTEDNLLKVKGYWVFKFICETKTFKRVK